MKKQIYIFIVSITILEGILPSIAFAQPEPGNRPPNCRANEQCGELSPDGKSLTLYYKEQTPAGLQERFSYAAIAREMSAAGQYIYKSDERNFYILFSADSENGYHVTQHYEVGKNDDWDQNPGDTQKFKVIGEGKAPTGLDDSGRYSWKPFITGVVNLNDGTTTKVASGAIIDMWLNSGVIANGAMSEAKGPKVGKEKTDDKGFKFQRKGSIWNDNMIFLSTYTIKNIVLCISYEDKATGKKYQKTEKIAFSKDWPRSSEDENALAKDNVQISFAATDEVKDWVVKPGATFQGPVTEIVGNQGDWVANAIKWIKCKARNMFIVIFQFEANMMGWLLRRNY